MSFAEKHPKLMERVRKGGLFLLPYFIFNMPEVARSLEEYRSRRPRQGRTQWLQGAQFPWESAWLDDGEVTPEYMGTDIVTGQLIKVWTGFIEIHITADVAYGVWQYYICTGDQEFMDKYGYELMLDCAKFWSSRLEPGADGQLHINDVVGPDCTEYDERIEQVNAAMAGLLARKGELEREDRTVPAQDRRILATTDTLEEASEIREGFNDALVYQTVSSIKVLDKDRLQVRFKDGTEVEQAIEHVGRQASA